MSKAYKEWQPGDDVGPIEGGAEVMEAVDRFLGRFVAYPSEHARVAHVLWVAHAHVMDAWFTTPRLAFLSAEKESGKTRALEVTELLVPDPLMSISISPAALVRSVAEGGVTILFDEIDALFGSARREEGNLDVRSILNGGYRRGAKVRRCVVNGKKIGLEDLDAFAAVSVAGLRNLPDTLASRCIVIRMQRRAPDEKIEQFRLRKVQPEAAQIKSALVEWCASAAPALADAEPELPASIIDRAAECWEPLVALADAAGGEWPGRARDAAKHLVAGSLDDLQTSGVELLEHVREAFGGEDRLWTETLLHRLHSRDESPWQDIKGKPLNDRGLALRLRNYGIKSKAVRTEAGVKKGYLAEDFAEMWKRLLPASWDPSVTRVTSVTELNNQNKVVTPVTPVTPTSQESGNGADDAGDNFTPEDNPDTWAEYGRGDAP